MYCASGNKICPKINYFRLNENTDELIKCENNIACLYIYICMFIYMYVYIYVYIEVQIKNVHIQQDNAVQDIQGIYVPPAKKDILKETDQYVRSVVKGIGGST